MEGHNGFLSEKAELLRGGPRIAALRRRTASRAGRFLLRRVLDQPSVAPSSTDAA
jgi:hypothetical protein